MKFSIPLKYLYEENRIANKDLIDAICIDLNTNWNSLPEYIEDEDEFLTLLNQICPVSEQTIEDGILSVEIYEYENNRFLKIPEYCVANGIPINLIEEPEFANEQMLFIFIRPNRITKMVPFDETGEVLIPLSEIMEIINNADEKATDTEIMIAIGNYLEENNPYSAINSIMNWV